jgi:2-hydroxychromene-2-carboxylate isomerase
MAVRPTIDFWFEFASTYSYLTAMRIQAVAQDADVAIRWRPFLLGPIFAAQGLNNSPFNVYPVKGKYMWRDMKRICDDMGLPLSQPNPFPQNSLTAARLATAARDEAWLPDFVRAVYNHEFGLGRSISDEAALAQLLRDIGADAGKYLALARSEDAKGRLKAETELAKSLGIFGSPSFMTTEGELFWGNDRLEQALNWAASARG